MSDARTSGDGMEMPETLRAAIVGTLRPVVPLPPPRTRVLWLVPFAIVLLFASVGVFGLRVDSPRVGVALTWGASTLQMALSVFLIAAALREAVPGTTLSRRAVGGAFGLAVLGVLTITWMTWRVSPTRIASPSVGFVWRVCLGATIISALPPLVISAWLTARAFPLRPRLAGALYGVGAGLMADAGWRLFCHYSDPAHVFGAHTLAVAVTTLLGVLLASTLHQSSPR